MYRDREGKDQCVCRGLSMQREYTLINHHITCLIEGREREGKTVYLTPKCQMKDDEENSLWNLCFSLGLELFSLKTVDLIRAIESVFSCFFSQRSSSSSPLALSLSFPPHQSRMIQQHSACAKTTLLSALGRLIFSLSLSPSSFSLSPPERLMALLPRQCLILSATHTQRREREREKATSSAR